MAGRTTALMVMGSMKCGSGLSWSAGAQGEGTEQGAVKVASRGLETAVEWFERTVLVCKSWSASVDGGGEGQCAGQWVGPEGGTGRWGRCSHAVGRAEPPKVWAGGPQASPHNIAPCRADCCRTACSRP